MFSKGYLAIPSRFEKLFTSPRTAYAREYGLEQRTNKL
jgi:hypothetical protein